MEFLVLTLFPEMFSGPLTESILKRAQDEKIISVELQNIREFGLGKYRQVDDAPYGGGAGMVMRVDVIAEALRAAKDKLPHARIVAFTPRGEVLSQEKCRALATAEEPLILLCGHFEGIDERVYEMFVDEELSLGDFVLTGGEIPAMALIDSVTRLLPGALGNDESSSEESFSEAFGGRLEHPQYTRPEEFEGLKVPEVLLSGHHAEIEKWRLQNLQGFTPEEKMIFDLRREYFSPQKPWKTKLFSLRTHLPEDLEYWLEWLNDEEITKYLPFELPYSAEDAKGFFAQCNETFEGLFLTICDRTTNEPIGHASLEFSNDKKTAAKFGIYLGAKELWGQGYGSAVVAALLKIAFTLLQVEKVALTVFSENLSAIKMYERAGFRTIGEARKEIKKGETFYDALLMEILHEKWEEQGKKDEVTQKFLDLRGDFAI